MEKSAPALCEQELLKSQAYNDSLLDGITNITDSISMNLSGHLARISQSTTLFQTRRSITEFD
jgi:hypothetical protein